MRQDRGEVFAEEIAELSDFSENASSRIFTLLASTGATEQARLGQGRCEVHMWQADNRHEQFGLTPATATHQHEPEGIT